MRLYRRGVTIKQAGSSPPPAFAGRDRMDEAPAQFPLGTMLFGYLVTLLVMAFVAALGQQPAFARTGGSSDSDEDDKTVYQYLFSPPTQHTVNGTPPHEGGHVHADLSEAKLKANQEKVRKYIDGLRRENRAIGLPEAVEIYHLAEDFRVVHSLLGNFITEQESVQIGKSRQAILDESVDTMAKRKTAGDRFGINDFGSGAADPDAKTDIDFTLYGDRPGSEMVKAFMDAFAEVTRKYGRALIPGQTDIVAHRYEALIPDWRQTQSVASFEAKLRRGTALLKANPEAYFLEGAYVQQIMGRSVEADNMTFTEISLSDEGDVVRTRKYAIDVPEFFYRPEVRSRYGWGGAVGNWHFWLAHSYDPAAAAKYLLRSINDGKRLTIESEEARRGEYEKLPQSARDRRVREMYGSQTNSEGLKLIQSVLDSAMRIRELKKAKTLNLATEAGQIEAYRPTIEYERGRSPIEMTDAELLFLAKDRYLRTSKRILIQNNIDTSQARLTDWLAPRVPEKPVIAIDEEGKMTKIKFDPAEVKRLNYAAFFELKDAISLMDNKQISRIQDANPQYHNDIEILKRLIETQKKMIDAPENLRPEEALSYRETAVKTVKEDYARLVELKRVKGRMPALLETGMTLYNRGNELDQWFQLKAVDVLASKTGGDALVSRFTKLRNAVDIVNERFETSYDPYLNESADKTRDPELRKKSSTLLSSSWMMRMNVSTSLMEVAKTYLHEGELNWNVVTTALYQGMGYVPGLGTLMVVQSGWHGASTLVFVQLVPGYGQMFTVLNLARTGVELAGTAIFEPLKQDKLLLYYQGHLDPAGGGLITSGQRERVGSPMPALLHPVDPGRDLPLDERREKMYQYIHERVDEKLRNDPEIWYYPDKAPDIWFGPERLGFKNLHEEFQKKELDHMSGFVDGYVEDWWNARGVFSGFDEILAGRAKGPDLRAELKQRLKMDYVKGKNIAVQKEITQQEERRKALVADIARAGGEDVALDKEMDTLGDVFLAAGKAAWAEVLEGMPAVEPAVEIIASPLILETNNLDPGKDAKEDVIWDINFRAKITGSTKNNPAPWKVVWEMTPPGAPSVKFEKVSDTPRDVYKNGSAEGKAKYFSEGGPMQVTATAIDANGKQFATGTITLNIEKNSFTLAGDEGGNNDGTVEPESDSGAGQGDGVRQPGGEKEKPCEEAKKKAEEAQAAVDEIKSRATETEAKIDEIEKKIKIAQGEYHETEDYEIEAYQASLKVVEAKQQSEKLALDICEKTEKMISSASHEDVQKLWDEIRTLHESFRKVKKEAEESLGKAKKAAEKAEKISEEYLSLTKDIGELNKTVDEQMSDLDTVGRGIRETGEVVRGEQTGGAADCIEEVRTSVASSEEEFMSLKDGLSSLGKQLQVSDSVRQLIEKMQKSAKEAQASVDAAEVYYDGIVDLWNKADKCYEVAGKAADKRRHTVAHFVVLVRGSGYTFTPWDGTYEISGSEEEYFQVRRGENVREKLENHRKYIEGDPCERAWAGRGGGEKQPPRLFTSGPQITIIDGPYYNYEELIKANRELKKDWHLNGKKGPHPMEMRKRIKCQ